MSDLDTPDRDLMHLHPELRMGWIIAAAIMESAGHPMRLVEGLRSSARQAHLYAQGRTRPGLVVTYARAGMGRHEAGPDGLGRAVDACFATGDPFGEDQPWELWGKTIEAQRLTWGGRWHRADRPHAQLRGAAPQPVVA